MWVVYEGANTTSRPAIPRIGKLFPYECFLLEPLASGCSENFSLPAIVGE